MNQKNKIYILFAGVLLLAVIAAVYFVVVNNRGVEPLVTVPGREDASITTQGGVAALRTSWADLIGKHGGKAAYEVFSKQTAQFPLSEQHLSAHIFGQQLYKKEGLPSLVVCNSDFGFGCFHGFFGSAVAEGGLAQVASLDKVCVTAFGSLGTGCQHGIGHGIMEYFGSGSLEDALAACKDTTQKSFLFGCTSGVFMEYNTPTILSDTAAQTEARPLDKKHPLLPCTDLPHRGFRLSCLYELAQFWQRTNPFPVMGEWCGALTVPEEKSVCMYGVANMIAVRTNFDVSATVQECKNFSTTALVKACAAGAAWSFYAQPGKKSMVPAVCNEDASCLREAVLICNFMPNQADKAACLVSNDLTPPNGEGKH